VIFPENLDLQLYQQSAKLVLRSVICHKGTPYIGHYKVFRRDDDAWRLYNDDVVTTATKDQVLAQSDEVVMLAYDVGAKTKDVAQHVSTFELTYSSGMLDRPIWIVTTFIVDSANIESCACGINKA